MAPSAAPPSRPEPIRIRDARAEECEALSALCRKSKAYWGYDDAFLEACAPYLQVTPDCVTAGHSFVALDHQDRVLGVAQSIRAMPRTAISTCSSFRLTRSAPGRGVSCSRKRRTGCAKLASG
jgi:hypothetical protein